MPRIQASKLLFSLLAAAFLALPTIPVSASPGPSRLDDDVAQRVQATPDAERIPVIVEGATSEARVRTIGGRVKGSSNLLGATVADLTPSEIRALSQDSAVDR